MIKIDFKGPSKQDLAKMMSAAAEKQISEVARRAAAPHGGVQLRFKRKADGSLASVEFEGSEKAVQAARDALAD
ncbi:MAG: hypothetical protein M0P63_08190 [Azoarcus sp.]|nr:hypothetical protein [Azoarcus sp.]